MLSQSDVADLPGHSVVGAGGQEIGKIEDVFAYSSTDAPAWAAISIDGALRPVPLVDAEMRDDTGNPAGESA